MADKVNKFEILLFGLAWAPRVFTECRVLIVAYLHLRDITLFPYIYNWLLVAALKQYLVKKVPFILFAVEPQCLKISLDSRKMDPIYSNRAFLDSESESISFV